MTRQADIRADFEHQLKTWKKYPDTRFERDAGGKYIDKKVKSMWEGYVLYHRKFDNYFSESTEADRSNGVGLYVIARITESNAFYFSSRPFRHKHIQVTIKEAEKLAKKHKAPFAILRCMRIQRVDSEIIVQEGEQNAS